MNYKDEIITEAEVALRKIKDTVKDAHVNKTVISPTLIMYMVDQALQKMEQIKIQNKIMTGKIIQKQR